MAARLVPWWRVIYIVACLIVLASDTARIGLPSWWWQTIYTAAALALLTWRVTLARPMLSVFGAFVFSASVSRAVTLGSDGRWAGVALNALVAMWVVYFAEQQGRAV